MIAPHAMFEPMESRTLLSAAGGYNEMSLDDTAGAETLRNQVTTLSMDVSRPSLVSHPRIGQEVIVDY